MHIFHKWEYGNYVRRCVKCGASYHRNKFSENWEFHGHTKALPESAPQQRESLRLPLSPV